MVQVAKQNLSLNRFNIADGVKSFLNWLKYDGGRRRRIPCTSTVTAESKNQHQLLILPQHIFLVAFFTSLALDFLFGSQKIFSHSPEMMRGIYLYPENSGEAIELKVRRTGTKVRWRST